VTLRIELCGDHANEVSASVKEGPSTISRLDGGRNLDIIRIIAKPCNALMQPTVGLPPVASVIRAGIRGGEICDQVWSRVGRRYPDFIGRAIDRCATLLAGLLP
jgi:hypothetical protein